MNSTAPKQHYLSVFVLAMMNVAVIMSLRGLPIMAKEGLPMIFFLAFASLLFLVPVSLVSAELATGWPESGGVYRWIGVAFGKRWGFVAIWLQWIQNVIWYPTVLAFAAGALAYLFVDPALAGSKIFNVVVILVVYWGATFMNFRGMKASGRLTTAGVLGGTIFPGILIIALGIAWVAMGKPIAFEAERMSVLPDFSHFSSIAFLAGVVLLFAGMEVGAVHVRELREPKTQFPKSVFLAMIIIIVIFTLGSFAIAAVLPASKISLNAGIMQAFQDMLHLFGLDWALPVLGFLGAFGAIGGVTAWIAGPSKGLLATATDGNLPPFLQKVNKNGVQTHILWVQGIIVTVISLVYLLMPNVSSAYFLLTALTAILYLIMYFLLYLAAIALRFTQPNVPRAYKVPGGTAGMIVVAGLGMAAVLFAIIVGLFPPSQLAVGSPAFYVIFLLAGIAIFMGAPLVIHALRKPGWMPKS